MMAISSPSRNSSPTSPTFTNSNSSSPPPHAVCIKKEQHVLQVVQDCDDDKDNPQEAVHVYPMNRPSNVCATLNTRELWKEFDALGTEMIVTRRGRRMFPPIKVELHNLNPNAFYVLLMDLAPVDKFRYKYQNSKWVKCFEEACAPTRLYIHPESPALGSYWMDHIVSFYKLKLTNNQLDKQGHIIVNSMHSYQPRLHIVESSDRHDLNLEDFHTIMFPGTQFTTVTAYQNDKITQLKIENNPFAKGFRQPMSRNRTRPIKYSYPTQSGSEAGSDDGIGYCNITQTENHTLNNATRRMSLKRSSSRSDDESCHPKRMSYSNEDGLVQVTPQINPFLPQTITTTPGQLPTPVYIVYTRGSSPPPTSSTPPAPLFVPQQRTATSPGYHIVHVQIPPSPSSSVTSSGGGQNGVVSPLLLSKKPSYGGTTNTSTHSSSESSDSESECESPVTITASRSPQRIIQPPPPLIPGGTTAMTTNFVTIPTNSQNLMIHPTTTTGTSGFIGHQSNGAVPFSTAHGNGILQAPTQQILVPVTALSQIHGKSNVLLQPLITTVSAANNACNSNGIIQYTPAGSHHIMTSDSSANRSFIQTLPVVVNGSKQGNFSKQIVPNNTSNTVAGQTFQLLTLPGRAPTQHIVDQAH